MFSRSQLRWFHTITAVLFVLCGVAHTIGQYGPNPADPATAALVATMKATHIADTSFTWWNVLMCWGALYGSMSVLLGAHALAVTHACAHDPRVVRASSRWLLPAAIAQAAIALFYAAPPPAFFMVPAAALAALAGLGSEKATER